MNYELKPRFAGTSQGQLQSGSTLQWAYTNNKMVRCNFERTVDTRKLTATFRRLPPIPTGRQQHQKSVIRSVGLNEFT